MTQGDDCEEKEDYRVIQNIAEQALYIASREQTCAMFFYHTNDHFLRHAVSSVQPSMQARSEARSRGI